MKNRITIGIFFFLFLLTASGVFAAMVGNSRQGSLAISVTSQPGSAENAAETYQGLTCIILNPVSVGAFTTKDPIGFNGGFNLYRYADNNPIRWTDPYGLTTVTQVLGNYFSWSNDREGLWIMLQDDEYTIKVRAWNKVQNLVNRVKANLEYSCEDWKLSHMTDSSWLPGMTDPPVYDPNAWDRWESSTTDPVRAGQALFNYILGRVEGLDFSGSSTQIPESLWTDAIGQFGIAATVDDIDCECHKATIRFWMYNSMDRYSLGNRVNAPTADMLGFKQARQYMWWNWKESHSW